MDNAGHTIKLSTGQIIPVWTLNGVVADNQHSSSTRVYSSGGGGFIGPNGGFIDSRSYSGPTCSSPSAKPS